MMEARQNCAMVRCLLPHSLLQMASARCKPLKQPLQSLNSPSAAKISSAARGRIAAPCGARYPSWGGGAPKKAAGKNEKYVNTQLAAVVLELKEP